MYNVIFYMDKDTEPHYVKVNENGLDYIREQFENRVSCDFIEVYCYDSYLTFAVDKTKVNAYSYKEEDSDE